MIHPIDKEIRTPVERITDALITPAYRKDLQDRFKYNTYYSTVQNEQQPNSFLDSITNLFTNPSQWQR